jgi:hypothetical protein
MTAFFFNFLVKISSLLIFCLSSSFAEISVNKNDDNKIELEYALNYQMNEEFEEIIDKGISINLIEEIKIVKERDYFFDKELYSQKNYKRIEYRPLIKKYYFYEKNEKKAYLSLAELIIDINKKRELKLKIKKNMHNNLLIINWKIEQNTLPKSLQLNLKKPDWFVLKTLTYTL